VESEVYRRYWPADVHIIGKDILRFHAVYWPAFLLSAGVALPKCVFGHGFVTIGGQKMSKSVGNVITPAAMREEFGLDQMRYFLMREVPYGQDGSISRELIVHRINGDLANDLGNLAQRVLAIVNKHCAAAVPEPGSFSAEDRDLLASASELLKTVRAEMECFAIHRMLEAIWRVVAEVNRYIDRQAPWALRKADPARMATVLYVCAETIRQLAIFVQPVVPDSAGRLLDQLSVPAQQRSFADLASPLVPGTKLPAPQAIFPRWQGAEHSAVQG
jgi:methionyl-tRNA synthetase